MTTSTQSAHSLICNIPVDVLEKQAIIDSIPHMVMIAVLFVCTLLSLGWYVQFTRLNKSTLTLKKKTVILFVISSILFALWIRASYLMVSVATNVYNPEYAGLVKYIGGCPQSITDVK